MKFQVFSFFFRACVADEMKPHYTTSHWRVHLIFLMEHHPRKQCFSFFILFPLREVLISLLQFSKGKKKVVMIVPSLIFFKLY